MDTYGGSDGRIKYRGQFYDIDELRTEVRKYGLTEAERVVKHQEDMEKLYSRGETDRATARYKAPRTKPYPDWLFYYHGAYS
jgi:hypothetical protein